MRIEESLNVEPKSSPAGEKESKALKLQASNNGRRKAYGSKRAKAYMKLCKTQGEDNVQASPNYKIKMQTSSTVVFIFAISYLHAAVESLQAVETLQ
ncbi:hypothetical protein Tco_0595705 [Tanacetum coccineum]